VRVVAENLSSFVAEIIGPAGAGKTSLSQLLRRGQDVRSGLSLWRLPPTLLTISAFSSLPSLVALCIQRKRFDWEDLKLVIQHNALLRLLNRESARRIRERDKPHRMKTRSDAEIENHLSLYRMSFERVVAELSKRNGLKVFRYRTDEVTLEEIATSVLLEARAQV
jgi:hypothetical protein